jgi:hypothetical protein
VASYWHILKSTKRFGTDRVHRIWHEERADAVVTVGYGNQPTGPGRDKLLKYRAGDRIIVYAPGFGAVAVAEATGATPEYRPSPAPDTHAHRLPVRWRATVHRLDDAVPAHAIRRAGGYVPRSLAMKLADDVRIGSRSW